MDSFATCWSFGCGDVSLLLPATKSITNKNSKKINKFAKQDFQLFVFAFF